MKKPRKKRAGSGSDLAALWLSPFVVAQRLPILMAETLRANPLDRPEAVRMWTEKMAAFQESWMATGAAVLHAWAHARPPVGPASWNTMGHAAQAIGEAALKPVTKRVRRNARRLAR